MKEVHFGAGCHINSAAQMLIDACQTAEKAQGTFNDITLTADKDSTVTGIVAYFHSEMERRAEEYRNSPEGKAAAREQEERRKQKQLKHDELMRQLPNLDFNSDVAILDWLCEFQDPSDYIGVAKQQKVVLSTFAENGYFPNVNCGNDFNAEDRDNFARWLIGQALDGLQGEVGAIHQVIHKFTDDWKRKFLSAAA